MIEKFDEILDNCTYLEYGDENSSVGLCKRVKNGTQQFYLIEGNKWYLTDMVWIKHNKRLPSSRKELSHICGLPNNKTGKKNSFQRGTFINDKICIEPTHIIQEYHWENTARRTCHDNIRKYESKIYRHQLLKNITPGPIYVNNIPITAQNILTPTPQIKYNKSDIQKEKEENRINKYKEQHKNKSPPPPNRKDKPYVCHCHPKCFINYNKWYKHLKRSQPRRKVN